MKQRFQTQANNACLSMAEVANSKGTTHFIKWWDLQTQRNKLCTGCGGLGGDVSTVVKLAHGLDATAAACGC